MGEKSKTFSESIGRLIEKAEQKKVAIIGGGVAGLAALKTFLDNGLDDVILLEAQDRLGGRVRTFRNGSVHVEDGAEWIHGEEDNIVYKIAQRMGQLQAEVENKCHYVREDGSGNQADALIGDKLHQILQNVNENNGILSDFHDQGYGSYYINMFNKDMGLDDHSSDKRAWMHYLEQVVNGEEGTDNWNDISASDADEFVDLGSDHKWKDGYDTLVTRHLAENLSKSLYLLKSPVRRIIWEHERLKKTLVVTGTNRSFLVDHVIVSVSVGYLKKCHGVLFSPALPENMRNALKHIFLGGPNKVFIGWKKQWWGRRPLSTSILWTDFSVPFGKEWLCGIVRITSLAGNPTILQAFVSGDYSRQMESRTEDEVRNDFLYLLRRLFRRANIPSPTFFRRTQWNLDPWACGSYSSFITVEGNKKGILSRAPFRQPLVNTFNKKVVHWAGEHTSDARYGTVDGAIMSGIREAKNIMNETG